MSLGTFSLVLYVMAGLGIALGLSNKKLDELFIAIPGSIVLATLCIIAVLCGGASVREAFAVIAVGSTALLCTLYIGHVIRKSA